MRNQIAGLAIAAAGATMLTSAAFAECGDIQMAEWNWASGELMANVDKFILENGYGCDVEMIPGATTSTFASMNEKGQPDVAGELWINAVREPLDKAIEEGRLYVANDGPITGLGEGWWVPPAFIEAHPDLTTVEKVLEHPELFPDVEDPELGAFVGCPAGWGCQLNNANLFRAFDMEEKGWKLVDPGSAAGLDGSMTKAVERGENWIGYYWSPTSLIGKHKMVLLEWETPWAGRENWDNCIVLPEFECADPQPTSWTKSEVRTVVTDEFMEAGGVALDYLTKRVFPGEVMNEMLVYMEEQQSGGEDAAIEFLLRHEDLWKTWVTEEAAAGITDAL